MPSSLLDSLTEIECVADAIAYAAARELALSRERPRSHEGMHAAGMYQGYRNALAMLAKMGETCPLNVLNGRNLKAADERIAAAALKYHA